MKKSVYKFLGITLFTKIENDHQQRAVNNFNLSATVPPRPMPKEPITQWKQQAGRLNREATSTEVCLVLEINTLKENISKTKRDYEAIRVQLNMANMSLNDKCKTIKGYQKEIAGLRAEIQLLKTPVIDYSELNFESVRAMLLARGFSTGFTRDDLGTEVWVRQKYGNKLHKTLCATCSENAIANAMLDLFTYHEINRK